MKKHIERREREQSALRNRILQAAVDIATEDGWRGVTVRKIADCVEYTTSVIYNHFVNKDAILEELVKRGFMELNDRFKRCVENLSDARAQLMAVSEMNWDFAFENRSLYELMFTREKHSSETALEVSDMIDEIFGKLLNGKSGDVNLLRLNWLCLRQGAITYLMSADKKLAESNKAIYLSFIERFISGI